MSNKLDGVLVVNKEKGMTSRDVVNEICKIFKTKKVGHTGTLDPLAEGVLVITIGNATKIGELLTSEYKEYIAGVLLGIKTDTYDIEGKVIDNKLVYDNLNIEKTISSYKKTYMQEVPIYSAVKVNGKKLYEYARNNEEVELPKKKVTIKKIELLSTDRCEFMFKALVSKGCYIRSLINDIGKSLNTYATMTKLTRTKQGKFTIEEAYTLDDIKNGKYKLYSIDEALDYPVIEIENDLYKKISNGVKIKNEFNIRDKVIFKYKDKILGIYEKDKDMLKTWKNFNVNYN
ncbi:MAG: tRNA pseudouridine(55) synthase TruB [Bacilli bacterium]|nr:tRNA pseudouridine(55) synthase TruB [Bacilli bacterium]